jgi:hypothetical protein
VEARGIFPIQAIPVKHKGSTACGQRHLWLPKQIRILSVKQHTAMLIAIRDAFHPDRVITVPAEKYRR